MSDTDKLERVMPINSKDLLSDKYVERSIRAKILAEQVNILYKNLVISIPANFVCATVVFAGLYQVGNNGFLWAWFLAIISISIFRIGLIYIYHLYPDNNEVNINLFILGTAISAALWGVADSFLMPDEQLLAQMIIIVIVAGITAGGIQTLQANLTSSILYVFLIVAPLCIWLFSQAGYSYFVLGIAMTTYLLFTLTNCIRGYKQLYQRLKLQFENLKLAETVTNVNAQLQQAIHSLGNSEEMLRNTEDNAPIGMAVASLQGRWLRVNRALCDILGYNREELECLSFQEITYPDDHDNDEFYLQSLLQGKLVTCQFEKRFIKKNGQPVWVLINESLLRDTTGKPISLIKQIQDISLRKDYEKKMATLNERTSHMLTQLQQNEDEMVLINKMNEMLQSCQKIEEAYSIIYISAQDLFPGLSGGLAIVNDKTHNLQTVLQWGPERLLKNEFSIDDCWGLRAGHSYIVNDIKHEVICNHFNGVLPGGYVNLPLMVQGGVIGMLHLNATAGNVITKSQLQLATIFNEVIKLSIANIRLQEALRDQAIHDPLTGLFNRRYLNEILQPALNRVSHGAGMLCVCMIDVDNFKQFNDLYGHEAGDEVLKFIGHLLQHEFHGVNVACRFGGEEFIVLLPDVPMEAAIKRMDEIRLLAKNEALLMGDKFLPAVTLSIGIAQAPEHGMIIDEIVNAADTALYTAKNTGKDKTIAFVPVRVK